MFNEKGYKAVCISVGATTNLTMHEEYYVYPNGENTFYVSRFPYPKKSLLGCYHKLHFKILEDITPTNAAIEEEPEIKENLMEEVQMSLF